MILPEGTDNGAFIDPHKEGMIQYLMAFRGLLEIATGNGTGFLLTDKGNLVAAHFKNNLHEYKGRSAIHSLMTASSCDAGARDRNFRMRLYDDRDFKEAGEICRKSDLLIYTPADTPGDLLTEQTPLEGQGPTLFDDETLDRIIDSPGVIAVSVFYEGFPVQSKGEADFELVAALAEDLRRQGTRIASDIRLGHLNKLTLETTENTFIIAPCGDLFLCIITHVDAPLGMIGDLLKSIRTEAFCDV
ncbi:MAG: roadblock/LC7 domain-containing protein [Methanoregula sp.]|nr:roadblock/LC7 domain-containing protein [Methanoregula sp.]